MYYVINRAWGGFDIPDEICEILGCEEYDDRDELRTNPILVNWVFHHTEETDLRVVDIPDTATDWLRQEYDGLESIICVIDGKLVHLKTIELEEAER